MSPSPDWLEDMLPLASTKPAIVFGQHAFQTRVVALDGDHGVVNDLADGRLLGIGLEMRPARVGGHPEDVFGFVFVGVFGVCAFVVALAGEQPGAVFLEGVGDVFQENKAEDNMLVFRRIHVVAQLVGGEPELGLEAEIGARIVFLGRRFRHQCLWDEGFRRRWRFPASC